MIRLSGRRIGQFIRLANDKIIEGEAGIQWRTDLPIALKTISRRRAQRSVALSKCAGAADDRTVDRRTASIGSRAARGRGAVVTRTSRAGAGGRLVWHAGLRRRAHLRLHHHFHAGYFGNFFAPKIADPVSVVAVDPVAHEAGWDRHSNNAVLMTNQGQRLQPASERRVTNLGPQPPTNPCPLLAQHTHSL